jgi:tetratricopeptide (TPR) repeat protein
MLETYHKHIGHIVDLMPSCMTEDYQHIAIEYMLLMDTHFKGKPAKVIISGLKHNLSRLDKSSEHPILTEELSRVYIDSLLAGLNNTKLVLSESLEKLKRKVKDMHDTKVMDVFLHSIQASRKVRAALDLPADEAEKKFAKAAEMFQESVKVNDFDYYSHFQLGWLYLWALGSPEDAQEHFAKAIDLSEEEDTYLHVFALRHLALTHFCQQDYKAALAIIKETRKHTNQEHVLVEFEYLRYALYAKRPELIQTYFESLANDHSLYYLLLQAEPEFKRFRRLRDLPETIRVNRIDAIQKHIDSEWDKTEMRKIQMEEGCNVHRVYLQVLNRYVEELQPLPFTQLEQAEKNITEKVLTVTKEKIAIEIDKRHKLYNKEIEEKQRAYRWVKKIGKTIFVASLYFIAALVLIGIYLFLDRYFLPGDSGINIRDWSILLSSLLITMSLSFLLTTFETSQVKKLYVKQKLVADALNKLQNKS